MNKTAFSILLLLVSTACVALLCGSRVRPRGETLTYSKRMSESPRREETENQNRPFGIDSRRPWSTSRIRGSPEPPPPYRNEIAFPKLKFKNPLAISNAPGTDRLFVVEQTGKLYSIPNDPDCAAADLFLDLSKEIRTIDPAGPANSVGDVYGLTFHPHFEQNRYCYISYVLNSKNPGEQLADGTRVSRFRVTEMDPPRCDPASERVIITWLAGGHNGGCLAFGPDGMLYISTGDATPPSPPDGLDAGQDMTKLLSGILRIDVDHPDGDRPYSIPHDNPFVSLEGVRPEKWAYGFRNPWKMSFDRAAGDLWVGDVGWESWELIFRVERAGNYGWSIMEGPQPVKPEGKRGPTPILPPAIALPHSEAASVTGGFVYRGQKLKDLVGAYIFGDWETRRIWAARWDGSKITSRQELVEPTLRIVAFAEANDGELFILDYDDGTIHKIVPNDSQHDAGDFPRRLSATGLFASVASHQPAPGVILFSINAEQWADTATAERLVALPGDSSVVVHTNSVPVPGTIMQTKLEWPKDAVLAKTISIEMERGKPQTLRRLETQILHFNGKTWHGYSYQWNDQQTDATLVDAEGLDRPLTIADPAAPGGTRKLTYNIPSRATCMRCHNPWAQHTLAFNVPQLHKDHDYGSVRVDQLRTLKHITILTPAKNEMAGQPNGSDSETDGAADPSPPPRLVDPYDSTAALNARARSYLQVNCAHCHQFGGGGSAEIDLRFEVPIQQTKSLGVRPTQGTFGIHDAHVLAPGDPYRSVLFYRISKLGSGRMPHIGSEVIDQRGVDLIHDWIRQLPVRTSDLAGLDRLREMDEPTALAREQKQAAAELEQLAKEIAANAKRDTVTDQDRRQATVRAKQLAADRVQARAKSRVETINQLLANTSTALLLARTIDKGGLPDSERDRVLAAATAHADVQVRDLFEKFLPDEKRAKRLGTVVKPTDLLALEGDAARGKELFHNTAGVACKNCHRIGDIGSTLGPELTHIASKYTRAQLLESILEPSKFIDPKYLMYLVETSQGRVLTGLLVEKTAAAVVLRDAQDQVVRIPAKDVQQFVPQRQSIMPELLLRDMTAEQVADLLEFLESLK